MIMRILRELIYFLITLMLLQFMAKSNGWSKEAMIDNTIGLVIAWVIWEIINAVKNRRNNEKN